MSSADNQPQPYPDSLRSACKLKVRRRRWLKSVTWIPSTLCFILPFLALAAFALPIFPARPYNSDATVGVASTVFSVHASIAGLAVVAFVFLLQTAGFVRRRRSVMLAFADRAGIRQATAYSFGTLSGEAVALFLCRTYGVLTLPVLASLFMGLISTIFVIVSVLFRCAILLNRSESTEVMKRALLDEVKLGALTETEHVLSSIWLVKYLRSPIEDFFGDFNGNDSWCLASPKKRVLFDVNLERIEAVALKMAPGSKIQFEGGLGWEPSEEINGFIKIQSAKNSVAKMKLARSLKWEYPPSLEGSLLADLRDEVVAAVQAGELGHLDEALSIVPSVISQIFEVLEPQGLQSDKQVQSLSAFRESANILRTALDESVRSGKADLVRKSAWTIGKCIRICAKARNSLCFEQLAQMFGLLRRAVRHAGLASDPRFRDVFWRPLKETLEMASLVEARSGDQFQAEMQDVVEGVFLEMFRSSIEEGASDLDSLLNAWRLTLGKDSMSRQTRTGRSPLEAETSSSVPWLALCAWTLYLVRMGRASNDTAREVFTKLGSRIGDEKQVTRSAAQLSARDDEDSYLLFRWIMWADEQNEGRVLAGGASKQIIEAYAAMLICRAQQSATGNLDLLLVHKEASLLANESIATLEAMRSTTDGLRQALVQSSIANDPIGPAIEASLKALSDARSESNRRDRAELRAKPLNDAKVSHFVEGVRAGFAGRSFFSQMSSIATVNPELKPPVEGLTMIAFHTLFPKEFFAGEDTGGASFESEFVESLVRGEESELWQDIADKAEKREVPIDALLDSVSALCLEKKVGCLVIQGTGTRVDVFQLTGFRYYDGPQRVHGQMGTLHGVPVFYGFDVKGFSALYLPQGSVKVTYRGSKEQPGDRVFAQVELITAGRSREIVEVWKRESPEKYASQADEEAEVLRLQETCGIKVSIRPEVECREAVAFDVGESLSAAD